MPDLALLLDEHYPAALARLLAERGVDAECVIARDDLRGQSDTVVLSYATQAGRVVVTEDVTTFLAAMAAISAHAGVVFCDSGRFPRTFDALPRLVDALASFASRPPDAARYPGFVWWLAEV